MNKMNVIDRATAPTPKFFKIVRTVGLVLASIGGSLLAAPVAIPLSLVNIAGYLTVAGGVLSAVAQITVDENQRKPIWWYHSDHLGSSSYLTDNFGRPTHYYDQLPFGESMVEHNQSQYYGNQYKFNGKELDVATGMYYYGARYYDPRLSIFISVDPLVEQTFEPYSYVGNNPINFIDPTGMSKDGDYYSRDGNWLGHDGVDDNKVYRLKDGQEPNYENKNVNWGGQLSEEHSERLRNNSDYLGTIQDAFVTGDAVSDKRIQSLHPAIRMQATDFIKEANANSEGTLIRVAQGFRTYAEQDALYAQGRTAPGNIVTKAKGGFSNHNFGLAFDIVGITNGKLDYNLDWKSLSTLGKSKGFEWGGDWKFKDMPHFENMFGNSLKELRALPKDKKGLPILKP